MAADRRIGAGAARSNGSQSRRAPRIGAALLGGVAAGVWTDVDAAVSATVRTGARIEPVDAWIEPYREARERFVALYPALRDV